MDSQLTNQADNLNQVLLRAMDIYARQVCFRVKRGERYEDITYWRFHILTLNMAHYLRQKGIKPGDRLALIADNSLEWMVLYVATLMVGGTAVPLRTSISVETLYFILKDSGAKLVAVQEKEHLQALLPPALPDAAESLPNFEILLGINTINLAEDIDEVHQILFNSISPAPKIRTDMRTTAVEFPLETSIHIFYVTGESGRLRGAVFDHKRVTSSIAHLAEWLTFEDEDQAFTLRPWSEAPSLLVALHYFVSGIPNALPENFSTAIENMQQASPTLVLTTPYSVGRLYESYMDWVAEQPEATQEVFKWAVAKGKEYQAAGQEASSELRQEYARADMTFFSRFRGSIGGRMRRIYSTGASLASELADFFDVVGIPVLNVYSTTEAGGFPAVNRTDSYHHGVCGPVAPGYEMRLGADDEILVRGPMIMSHYWHNQAATEQAIDPDGWLHTGDTGCFDEADNLIVTGRKQHLIVLSTGRKVAPVLIEKTLTDSPFITQAAVFGEGKPYVSAMILPNLQTLSAHFQQEAAADDDPVTTTGHPKVKALLDEIIGQVNNRLDRWEQVREYSLLDQPLSEESGELTSSARISRHAVAKRYAAQIEAMYPMAVQFEDKTVTEVQVNPERLRALLEKENILDAWMADAGIEFLFDIARNKQIDAPSMVHISDAAATIAQMENEEKPLSTAIIVGDPVRIGRTLPESQIKLLRHDHIRRMRSSLVTLAQMVDGIVLGYVVDKYGYVRGIHKLDVKLDEQPVSFLLGPQFRHHAAISQQCNAVVFFVPAGGRQVRVFADGKLLGRYSSGDWSPESIARVDETVAALTEKQGYPLELAQRVLRCAFQMSEKNMGAIFIIGNAKAILDHSDDAEISHFAAINQTPLNQMSDAELINFAKQDGATVIDVSGDFWGCMVLLRPNANPQAEIGAGKGARHSSATKMSAEFECMAITVSQDGPITIYDHGKRVLSL